MHTKILGVPHQLPNSHRWGCIIDTLNNKLGLVTENNQPQLYHYALQQTYTNFNQSSRLNEMACIVCIMYDAILTLNVGENVVDIRYHSG